MKIVKLSFNYDFPIFRQSPGFLGIWGNYKFIIDESILECDYWLIYSDHKFVLQKCICPKENIFFIPAECYNTSVKYPKKFLEQFGTIITVQTQITGKNVIYHQNANPWFINRNYDELIKLIIPEKTKLISIISSNKQVTTGHKKRLDFSLKLKKHFGDRADLFGRGINDFEDKWDVLAPYKYTIAIENDYVNDWMTEKIIDPILTFTMPFYYGCPNINKYLNPTSYLNIDIDDFEGSINIIEDAIRNDLHSKFMVNAKEDILLILNKHQLFPMCANFFQKNHSNFDKCENTIYPIEYFDTKFKTKSIFKMIKKIINFKKRLYSKIIYNDSKITANELIQKKRCIPWFEINGDQTLRLNYDLDESSIVFDIGGYKGEFASDIFCKYSCFIFIFEPIKEYYDLILHKFKNNNKVKVFPFALGKSNSTEFISLDQNSSSLFTKSKNKSIIEIKSINDFINDHKLSKIDLMKINIEGAEYDLMESLILKNNHLLVNNFQIQFHDFIIENAKERMYKIQDDLAKSHTITYKYEFVWENWKKNSL